MGKIILQMKNITKTFGPTVALEDVSLNLEEGEIHALCGENGAGKSTLMKILSGSYRHSEYGGDINIDGNKVVFNSIRDAEKQGIEMIYQEISLHYDLSVAENIFLGKIPSKNGFINWPKLMQKGQEALDLIGLDVRPQEIVRNLNTSQQQLIAIARALSSNPRMLVLDEPTSALTEKEADYLFEIIFKLRNNGISSLYISHKMNEVFRLADRVSVLRDGKHISTYKKADTDKDRVIEDMVGRKLENLYPKEHAEIGKEILRIEDFYVPYPFTDHKNIVDGVSFSLKMGEVLGIAGLVGSGRSELLDAIFRVRTHKVKGKLYFEGKEVFSKQPKDSKNLGMGYLTEDRKKSGFIWTMNIKQNLTLVNFKEIFSKGFVKSRKENKLAKEYFKKFSIKAPGIETMITSLSGGNQQKVVLAKWLMTNIKVLLLDEPTRGIDVGAKAEIYKLISQLAKGGMAVIIVSSEMQELIALCDRILVLSNGKIRGEFNRDEVTQEKIMKAAASV